MVQIWAKHEKPEILLWFLHLIKKKGQYIWVYQIW
jgi:hypothetical protein